MIKLTRERLFLISLFKYLEIYQSDFKTSKTEKFVRDCSEDFDIPTLGSVSLGSGVHGCMVEAKFVQAAMGSHLEICIVKKSAMAEYIYISIQTANL